MLQTFGVLRFVPAVRASPSCVGPVTWICGTGGPPVTLLLTASKFAVRLWLLPVLLLVSAQIGCSVALKKSSPARLKKNRLAPQGPPGSGSPQTAERQRPRPGSTCSRQAPTPRDVRAVRRGYFDYDRSEPIIHVRKPSRNETSGNAGGPSLRRGQLMCRSVTAEAQLRHSELGLLDVDAVAADGLCPVQRLISARHERLPNLRQHGVASRPARRVRPFPGDELPVPAKNRLGRDNRGNLRQYPATKTRAEDCQAPPFVVGRLHDCGAMP